MVPRGHRCQGLVSVHGRLQYHSHFSFCSLYPGAQELAVCFQPDLTEMSQKELFSRRLGSIQAAGRKNLASVSAEGHLNGSRCWSFHVKEQTLKHPLSREEAFVKALAHCKRPVGRKPTFGTYRNTYIFDCFKSQKTFSWFLPVVTLSLCSLGGICMGNSRIRWVCTQPVRPNSAV